MKKFFAAALASAMVVSMAATSFAAATVKVEKASGATTYNSDTYVFTPVVAEVAYGKAVFYQLLSETNAQITEYDAVKGTSITQKWELNGSAVEKLEIVKKKNGTGASDYAYYLSVKTKDNSTLNKTDVVGTVTLRKSGTDGFTSDENKFNVPVNFTLGYGKLSELDGNKSLEVQDSLKIMFDPALTGDQTITFAKASNNYFEVNVDGQGKLLVKADVKYNADIAAKYPAANLDFFTGNGASFNKIGELTIAAAPGSFLYAVNADGNLTAVKATYDEYEEAFKIKTRTLGAYVISDAELKLVATTPVDPAKPNPGTGANA